VTRAALTLEVLAKQWRLGRVEALAICGHPHGRVPVPGTAQASRADRWFYCLYGRREGQWEVVREAQNSALRGRTWWSLDQCLQALASRQVVPTELRLLPRGPAPPDFPKLPVETAPTESTRRKPAADVSPAAAAKVRARSPVGASWLRDEDDGVADADAARGDEEGGGAATKEEGAGEGWDTV